jgi:hypothetical protein
MKTCNDELLMEMRSRRRLGELNTVDAAALRDKLSAMIVRLQDVVDAVQRDRE